MSCSQQCNQGRTCTCRQNYTPTRGEPRWKVLAGCFAIGIVFAVILFIGMGL